MKDNASSPRATATVGEADSGGTSPKPRGGSRSASPQGRMPSERQTPNVDPTALGRKLILITAMSAIAFALAAYFLVR